MTKLIRLDGVVPGALAGLRADQAIAKVFPQHSRARIQSWIRAGTATLDGAAVRVRDRVAGGERVRHPQARSRADERVGGAAGAALHTSTKIADLLVLDKPRGARRAPRSAGNRDGTLLNRLLARTIPGLRSVPRAGLVHRLDKDTSGLLLVARGRCAAHTRLVALHQGARAVERTYEAVVARLAALLAGRWRRRSAATACGAPGWG